MGNPIANLNTKRHALILIKDKEGNYLLGERNYFYPNGIVSLKVGWA